MKRFALFFALAVSAATGCDKPPTPEKAKSNAVAKLEKMHASLTEQINSGKVPPNAKNLSRESGVLQGSLGGTPAGEAAKKLYKQVDDFEGMLEKDKPDIKKVGAALQAIGETIAEMKSKM